MNDAAQVDPVAEGVTAGALLRRAREATGLHIATLAVSLKVPVRKLEALEADRYEELSDAVFVRALASSVCRTLKIDPQPVLERLPQGGKPRLVQDRDGINAPFRAPGDGPKPGWGERVARPVPLAVGALLLATVAVALVPGLRGNEPEPAAMPQAVAPGAANVPSQTVVTEPAPVPAIVASGASVTPLPAPSPAADASSAGQSPAITEAPPAPPGPAAVATVASVPPSAAPASAAAVSASAAVVPSASTGIIVFRTRGPSWVHVTDAKGTSVLRRILETGETVGVSGAVPLSVTVGSAQSTQVQVRGKPMDLAPITRDNVARFEVR